MRVHVVVYKPTGKILRRGKRFSSKAKAQRFARHMNKLTCSRKFSVKPVG